MKRGKGEKIEEKRRPQIPVDRWQKDSREWQRREEKYSCQREER